MWVKLPPSYIEGVDLILITKRVTTVQESAPPPSSMHLFPSFSHPVKGQLLKAENSTCLKKAEVQVAFLDPSFLSLSPFSYSKIDRAVGTRQIKRILYEYII